MDIDNRGREARRIVEKYVWWSAGVGLVPLPLIDMAAISIVNVKMLKELSEYYGVEYWENRGKSIVSALLGGVVPGFLATSRAGRFLKLIPVIGHPVGAVAVSIFGGAATYAIGRVFIRHYESGGTMLNFDTEKAKEFAKEQYQKGKDLVSRKKPVTEEPSTSPA